MPPILGTIDWASVYASGVTFDVWMAAAGNPDRCSAMSEALNSLALEPQSIALLGALARPVHVVAIAEDWCGDVVRHVPVLQRIALAAPQLGLRFITRAQHKDVFARFLTNGGEAIPKFVFLNDRFVECGHWGPMPEACKRLIARGKACGDVAAARRKVTALYQADADCRDVVHEILELIETAAAISP